MKELMLDIFSVVATFLFQFKEMSKIQTCGPLDSIAAGCSLSSFHHFRCVAEHKANVVLQRFG